MPPFLFTRLHVGKRPIVGAHNIRCGELCFYLQIISSITIPVNWNLHFLKGKLLIAPCKLYIRYS